MPKSDSRKWNGVEITGTPTPGQVPTAISAEKAVWDDVATGTADLTNAVILAPTTSTRNVITPTGAAVKPLVVKGAASQSASL